MTDFPTDGDRHRIRAARLHARSRVSEIEAARDAAIVEAFRIELGAVVRSASPLLAPILAADGLTIDDTAMRVDPPPGWPRHRRLSGQKGAHHFTLHAYRHYLAAVYPKRMTCQPLIGCKIRRQNGDYIAIHVVDHSLELTGRIGRVRLETRFGELRVEALDKLPETIFAPSVGSLIEEIVDHESWRGRGWRIVAVEEADGFSGNKLIAQTGSVGYRMPWAT